MKTDKSGGEVAKNAHTQGEWKSDGLKITCYGAGIVAKCVLPQEGGCMAAMANSKLIAAAPEMLEALNFAIRNHGEQNLKKLIGITTFDLFKAAIKKAGF